MTFSKKSIVSAEIVFTFKFIYQNSPKNFIKSIHNIIKKLEYEWKIKMQYTVLNC